MLLTKLKLTLCLCLCLLAAACGRAEYEYADSEDVKIENVTSRSLEGGFMEVTAVFRGTNSGERQTSYYQIHWYDEDGILAERSSWRPLSMRGTAPMPVRERSTKPNIKDFTIIISNKAY